jgi:hypothetical protein
MRRARPPGRAVHNGKPMALQVAPRTDISGQFAPPGRAGGNHNIYRYNLPKLHDIPGFLGWEKLEVRLPAP